LGMQGYIRAQVAPQTQRYTEWMNSRYAPVGYRFEANVTEQSLGHSALHVALRSTDPQDTDPTPPKITATVTHGPVWFGDGIGAGLARIEAVQRYRDYQALLRRENLVITPETGEVRTVARIGFDGKVHAEGTSDAFVLKDLRTSTQFSVEKVTFSGSWEPYTLVGNYRARTSAIRAMRTAKKPLFEMDDVVSEAHIDSRISPWLYEGGGLFRAAQIHLYNEKGEKLEAVPRLAFAIHGEANDTIAIRYQADLNVTGGAQVPLRALHTEVSWHGIARSGLEAMLKGLRRWQSEQLELERKLAAATGKPEKLSAALLAMQQWQKQVAREAQEALLKMLVPGKTTMQMRTRIATDHAPMNEINATVRLLDTLPQGDAETVLRHLVTQYPRYIGLDLSVAFGTHLLNDLGSTGQGYTTWMKMAQAQGYLRCQQGICRSTLHYRPDALTINGTAMPKLLLMIKMMSLGGFFQ